MKAPRRLVWLLLALLFACLPLGGTSAADRGIGGTGAPTSGAPTSGPRISDRGIGGTGIVGVITGFGSVFVDGLEVAYTPGTPMTVDGMSDMDAAPRVGQLAAIVASEDNGLRAVSIDLRHEVSGPVESVSPNGVSPNGVSPNGVSPNGVSPNGVSPNGVSPDGVSPDGVSPNGETLVVAGQTVAIDGATEGQRTVHPGDWVAVSGLRQPDGVIAASRIDQRVPGTVLVRGTVTPGPMRSPGEWRIGDLSVQPPVGASLAPGANVTVRGTMANGGLSETTVDPDVLSSDPAAFFGAHVRRMVIESYVSAAGGQLRLGRGWLAVPGRGVVVPAGAHRAIVQLERGAHGDFVATHLRGAAIPRGGAIPRGDERPGAPHGGDRHGALEPPHASARLEPRHAAAHPFGAARFEPHPWRDRGPDAGRAGYMPRRSGCEGGGCRGGRRPR